MKRQQNTKKKLVSEKQILTTTKNQDATDSKYKNIGNKKD